MNLTPTFLTLRSPPLCTYQIPKLITFTWLSSIHSSIHDYVHIAMSHLTVGCHSFHQHQYECFTSHISFTSTVSSLPHQNSGNYHFKSLNNEWEKFLVLKTIVLDKSETSKSSRLGKRVKPKRNCLLRAKSLFMKAVTVTKKSTEYTLDL